MALALILSSFVAASRIGGAAQQYVLAAHGIDPVGGEDILLRASADTRGGDEGGKDQRHRHGADPYNLWISTGSGPA